MDATGFGELKRAASGISASGEVLKIDLAKETAKEEFAGFNPAIGIQSQRWYMLIVIGAVFTLLNAAVIGLIIYAINIDVAFMTEHPALVDKRIITGATFHTLIGATVVQTGAVTWAMARFLFPTQSD